MVLITKMNDVVTPLVVVRLQELWFPQDDMCRRTEVIPGADAVGMYLPAKAIGLRGSFHRVMLFIEVIVVIRVLLKYTTSISTSKIN